MIIELQPQDIIIAAHNAGLVNGVKVLQEKSGLITNKRFNDKKDFELHYIGQLGEIAVSRAIGVSLITEIMFGGDSGTDLTFAGKKIQIKTNTYQGSGPALLKFNSEEDFSADIAILCCLNGYVCVDVKGFVSKRKFMMFKEERDFGNGTRLCLDEKHLTPIDRLKEALGDKK